ncbi:hypothetical protein BDV98DRAFT_574940 [Pterulicium gracile]|uniref:Extracellular membrane protein CFEM domain-containing protein n=1 Tax=Pterulicium gracile TaxID=1884261 RepID=A0A5C3Q7V4_9AGAR|nr:hypothetical protein BDV98DRAFT_574940 [Pterula gracilis]
MFTTTYLLPALLVLSLGSQLFVSAQSQNVTSPTNSPSSQRNSTLPSFNLDDLPTQCKTNCTNFITTGWGSPSCQTNGTCVCSDTNFQVYGQCIGCLLQNYPDNLNVSKANFTRAQEVVAASTFTQCNLTNHNVSFSTIEQLNNTFHENFTANGTDGSSSHGGGDQHEGSAVGLRMQMSAALVLALVGVLVTLV